MEFRLKAHQWFKQTKLFKDLPNATLWLDRFFWTLKVWPLHLLLLIIFFHLLILAYVPDIQEPALNKSFGSILQIVGAGMVLWIISQNLGLLTNRTIMRALQDWIRGYPYRHSIEIKVHDVHQAVSCSSCATTVRETSLHTVESKLDYLFKRSEELDKKIDDTKNSFNNSIGELETKVKKEIKSVQVDINSLKATLKETVLGGVKIEIAGFLIAAYGVVISGFLS